MTKESKPEYIEYTPSLWFIRQQMLQQAAESICNAVEELEATKQGFEAAEFTEAEVVKDLQFIHRNLNKRDV